MNKVQLLKDWNLFFSSNLVAINLVWWGHACPVFMIEATIRPVAICNKCLMGRCYDFYFKFFERIFSSYFYILLCKIDDRAIRSLGWNEIGKSYFSKLLKNWIWFQIISGYICVTDEKANQYQNFQHHTDSKIS